MKQPYPVLDAQSAIHDYNKKLGAFQEIQSRLIKPIKLQVSEQPGMTLETMLQQNGHLATPAAKMALARKMGMSNYFGTPEQDKQLMAAYQGQAQKQGEQAKLSSENDSKQKEFGLKERELSLKEQEMKSNKPPSADEVAQSLLKTYKK